MLKPFRLLLLPLSFAVGFMLPACQAQETMSRDAAEHHYLGNLFKLGIPQAGWVLDNPENLSEWTEIQVVWYDSAQAQWIHYSYEAEGDQVYLSTALEDSSILAEMAKRAPVWGKQNRDLSLPSQNEQYFLPFSFWSISFNDVWDQDYQVSEPWQKVDCDRPRRGAFCIDDSLHPTELALADGYRPRVWKFDMENVSMEEMFQGLDSLIADFQVEPDLINWTVWAKQPIFHGVEKGGLFNLLVLFESPYPGFRVFYTYNAFNKELSIKLENTRPTYGPKQRFTRLCAHGPGSNYACEFLDMEGFRLKRSLQP